MLQHEIKKKVDIAKYTKVIIIHLKSSLENLKPKLCIWNLLAYDEERKPWLLEELRNQELEHIYLTHLQYLLCKNRNCCKFFNTRVYMSTKYALRRRGTNSILVSTSKKYNCILHV